MNLRQISIMSLTLSWTQQSSFHQIFMQLRLQQLQMKVWAIPGLDFKRMSYLEKLSETE